jgi:AbrB family looped-hinge helix DNA binding protein
MKPLATAKLSSKGQIVIPEAIREHLRLHTDDEFVVYAADGVIVLRAIAPANIRGLSSLMKIAKQQAKQAGLTQQDVAETIKAVHKE